MRVLSMLSPILKHFAHRRRGVVASRWGMVRRMFGHRSMTSRIVYGLVGLAGLLQIVMFTWRAVRGRRMPAMG